MEVKIQPSIVTLQAGKPSLLRLNEWDKSKPQRMLLALDGNSFVRRQHIRPFESKRKLSHILPSLIEDSLLGSDKNKKLRHILTTSSLEENKFTSYSLHPETLKEASENITSCNLPLLAVAPLPLGLTYFAPKNVNSILIAPCTSGYQLVAVHSDGQMVDYRTFTTNKWKEQASLTLQTWISQMEDVQLWATPDIKWPINIDEALKKSVQKIELPQNVSATNADTHGLLHIFNENWYPDLSIPYRDTGTQKDLETLFRKLRKTLPVFLAALVLTTLHWAYTHYEFLSENEKVQTQIEDIFDEALPGTPLVDAPLQLTRRVNELALLSGNGLVNTSPLGTQLVTLQKRLTQTNIGVSLDDLNITQTNLKLRGQVASLSHVDQLQQVVKNVFEGYTVELKSAQISEDSKVNFHIEAVKK